MKSSKWLLLLVFFTLFYPVLSCQLMETEAFQNLKEVNTFKPFEDIPFFTNQELLDHLKPYATIEDEVITDFNKAPAFELVVEETDTNTNNSEEYDYPVGTSDIRIKQDLLDFISKIETMVVRNTLTEFVENGQGNIGKAITNLEKIRLALNEKLVIAEKVGYMGASVKTSVETKVSGISQDITDLVAALQEGGM